MASDNSDLLHCYNRGCGMKFSPNENKEDSCCFHPGNPVFHDGYKGWSCCNKRSVDFTEFLNFKGCAKSFHSNKKPPEPVKPVVEKSSPEEIIAPMPKVSKVERPPFDSPMTRLQPELSEALKTALQATTQKPNSQDSGEIQIGTNCKNAGCKDSYEGPESCKKECFYHSGAPVFHEGFKYWSCCNKKTTDFAMFLDQVGCTVGKHVWVKQDPNVQAGCRYDWHQTGSHVYVSVYAKKYDPDKLSVEINPIRLKIHLEFPADNSRFDRDFELCGLVDTANSGVYLLPAKVEVKLKKAEPGSWAKLMFPNRVGGNEKSEPNANEGGNKTSDGKVDDDIVDLSDINN